MFEYLSSDLNGLAFLHVRKPVFYLRYYDSSEWATVCKNPPVWLNPGELWEKCPNNDQSQSNYGLGKWNNSWWKPIEKNLNA